MNIDWSLGTWGGWLWPAIAIAVLASLLLVAIVVLLFKFGDYWLQAKMCGADVSFSSLILMAILRLDTKAIVIAKIMATQSGLSIDRVKGLSTSSLIAHQLTGGDITKVVQACIVAKQAKMDLDFQRAAAMDLAGRDVLLAVQTSISPVIIRCPSIATGKSNLLSAVAKNGVELRADARITVRTELNRLIGGATEETLIARIGQAIIAEIGSAETHMDVLAMPSNISKRAMENGLDANTAFAIVSIDIYHLVVGENIGARLRGDQAEADIRIAQAHAEGRRAEAFAVTQQMKAKIAENRALVVLSEAAVPYAVAHAFREGCIMEGHATETNCIASEPHSNLPDYSVTIPIRKPLQL